MQPSFEGKPRVKRFSAIPSLDEWLSHSVTAPMVSTADDSGLDDTGSSLGDSSYDFLDDGSTVTTDDEGSANLTLSFSSSDRAESETPVVQQLQASALTNDPDEDGEDTTEDNQGSHLLQGGDWGIKFEETEDVSDGATNCFEVSYTLREIETHEIDDVTKLLEDTHPTKVNLTVKQNMASHTLAPNEPLRVLFVGDSKIKDAIMQKLGSALAASSESSPNTPERAMSRFSVVPISSFGEPRSRSPEVMLVDSVGLEIRVQECIHASFSRKEDGNDSICLAFSDDTSVSSAWMSSESRFALLGIPGGWDIPDVAVIYLSDTDSITMKSTQRFARSFVTRHRIPCLFVAQTQLLNSKADSIILDNATPHLCLEPSISRPGGHNIIKRLPIDLSTFLELDARQLNKNLACLVSNRRAQRDCRQRSVPQKCLSKQIEPAADRKKEKTSPLSTRWSKIKNEIHLRFADQWLLFITMLSLLIFLPGSLRELWTWKSRIDTIGTVPLYRPGTGNVIPMANVASPKVPTPSMSNPTKPTVSYGLATTFSTEAPTKTPIPTTQAAVDSNTDLAAFLLDTHALTPNNSAKFKVHVVGDRHVVLRPPRWFMRYRKAPKLYFSIMRQKEAVDHELLMLFDGVYALKIACEEAYGTVNITVHTMSKPKINETFQVDFANTWLKAAGWKKAAHTITKTVQSNLVRFQNGLSIVYAHTGSELHVFANNAVRTVNAVRQDMECFGSASMNYTFRTTDLILGHTKDLSCSLSSSLANVTSTISRQLALYNQHVQKDLALYLEHQKAAIKQGGRSLSRLTPQMDLKSVASSVDSLRVRHLRATQKMALKAWWKLIGTPKQTLPKSVDEKPTGKKRGASKRKRNGIR